MNFNPPALPRFDPSDAIKSAFGGDLAFIIVVPLNGTDVKIYERDSLSNPAKPGLPKNNITLQNVAEITVLSWEGSPGCKTVCSGGNCYEKC